MSILCKLFGHKPGVTYRNRNGSTYLTIVGGKVDNTGYECANVFSECDRCGKKFRVGNLHLDNDKVFKENSKKSEKQMVFTNMPQVGGLKAGLVVGATMIDQQTGQPYALLVSPARPDNNLSWDDANAWAASLGEGFRLPSLLEGVMLLANNKQLEEDAFEPEWHWLNEQSSTGFAWHQDFYDNTQSISHKDYECRARAVIRADIVV